MSAFVELLGATLQSKAGTVATADALQGKQAVALYFSAHWCPPCRGFTPQFSKWYAESLTAKGLEVVFVSSDRDEAAFKEYFGEMPWLALPYTEEGKALKATLSKKYKVQGIPSVVILGPDAQVITKDGRDAISGDPTGKNFPWKPKTREELLASMKLVNKDGATFSPEAVKGKVLGLYFSAHWCPPCRGFTPKLAEWYTKDLKAKGLEVVFVSSDRDEAAFKEYLGEMPWLALDYSDRTLKEELSNLFGVEGIPTFVILDEAGNIINKEGRGAVSSDPTGENFPWHPKPVGTVEEDVSCVNEIPTVIAFCEGDAAACDAAKLAMEPIGKRMRAEAKAKGEDDPELCFLVATQHDGVAKRIRSMTQLPEAKPEAAVTPKLLLLDIPDEGGYYHGPEGAVTAEAVEKLVADYKAKAIPRKQLEG